MAKNTSKEKKEDILENPEYVAEERIGKAEAFVEKNKQLVTYIGGVIAALIVLIWFGFNYYQDQSKEAQVEMFPAQFYFDRDSFDLALNGDGASLGFLDIAKEYSWTKAGNLSNFYIGVCYMQKGQFEDAIEYLSDFDADDWILDARASSLIGDAHMELDQPAKAIASYKSAVSSEPNKAFTPQYMMKLALAYEKAGNWNGAAEVYNNLISKYPSATEIQDAKRFKARAEVEAQRTAS
jgi:predicted negative regulator of RcsB-dependent stress response